VIVHLTKSVAQSVREVLKTVDLDWSNGNWDQTFIPMARTNIVAFAKELERLKNKENNDG